MSSVAASWLTPLSPRLLLGLGLCDLVHLGVEGLAQLRESQVHPRRMQKELLRALCDALRKACRRSGDARVSVCLADEPHRARGVPYPLLIVREALLPKPVHTVLEALVRDAVVQLQSAFVCACDEADCGVRAREARIVSVGVAKRGMGSTAQHGTNGARRCDRARAIQRPTHPASAASPSSSSSSSCPHLRTPARRTERDPCLQDRAPARRSPPGFALPLICPAAQLRVSTRPGHPEG